MSGFLALALLAQALHLEEAFARAREASPDVRAARESVRAAQAGVDVARQLSNPTVGISVGPDDPKVFGTFDVKLPILGQRGTAIAAAERDVEAAEADAQARSVQVRAAVRRAYAALAAAQTRSRLSARALQLAEEVASRTEAKVRAGLAPQLEAVQADLAHRRAVQERDDRRAALAAAREELGRALAIPEATALEAADGLLPLPSAPPLPDLLERAARHPEVRALQRQEDAALARADRERAAIRPVPDVTLELMKLQEQTTLGLRAGLAFDLPVLSWNSGRIREAQAQAQVASAQAQAALQRRQAELRGARARWDAAAARAVAFSEQIVPAARRLVQMARDAWELGRTPLTQVLLAQAELNGAEAEANDAALAAQQALGDMEEAAGEGL